MKQMGICVIIFASYLSVMANSSSNAKLATRYHMKMPAINQRTGSTDTSKWY